MSSVRLACTMVVLFAAAAAIIFGSLLRCIGSCVVDLETLQGPRLGEMGLNDTRLHVWILAWVQRSLLSDPRGLFQANAFHPAPDALAGSEHTIGIALFALPLRIFSQDPVLVYNATLFATSVLLAGTTAILVRWLTGSTWIGLLCGVVAIGMPWRMHEVMHLQLLAVQWIPLIWLLTWRILAGSGRSWDPPLLAVALALQLLSSYYVAYFVTASLGVLLLVEGVRARPGWRRFATWLAAATPAYVLLGLASVPYLGRRAELETLPAAGPDANAFVAGAWRAIAPGWETAWSALRTGDDAYRIPIVGLVLAALGLLLSLGRRRTRNGSVERCRMAALALWCVMLAAFVMMLGSQLVVGDFTLPLPAAWASALVPGFASLRAPWRWSILIGLAIPLLAGIGLRCVELRIDSRRLRIGTVAGLAVLLLVHLPLRPLPVRPVWEHPERVASTYRALRELPHGPVLEIPWRINPLQAMSVESRYLLASTLHWRPILNGFTAYPPPTYAFLRRIAQQLPQETALEKLRTLVDVRWIVVHLDRLGSRQREPWLAATRHANLREVHRDPHALILEVPQDDRSGVLMDQLVSAEQRTRTLGGVSRRPLELPRDAGRLEVQLPERGLRVLGTPLPQPIELTIRNESDVAWPGFDFQREGLVELRYVFADPNGPIVAGGYAALDADVPARGSAQISPLILPPDPGRYRLCLDLVQRVGSELRPLPLTAVELELAVGGRAHHAGGAQQRFAAFGSWLEPSEAPTAYRCRRPGD